MFLVGGYYFAFILLALSGPHIFARQKSFVARIVSPRHPCRMPPKRFEKVSPDEASKQNKLLTHFFSVAPKSPEPPKKGRKKKGRGRGRPAKKQSQVMLSYFLLESLLLWS